MNINGRHNKAPTLTKKQRKSVTEAVKRSINKGGIIEMITGVYRGANPEYKRVTRPDGSLGHWLKVQRGVPFVKVVQ